MKKFALATLSLTWLGACAHTAAPAPVIIQAPTYPAFDAQAYAQTTRPAEAASLWSTSPNALLSMRRAKQVGDLLTVIVEMNDRASLQSSLSRSRDANEELSVDALFGLPEWMNGVLPGGATLSPGIDTARTSDLSGSGTVSRAEKVAFTLATRVVGVEPNGNLIIQGYQETHVSGEVRYLAVSGVIRSQDVTRTNTVSYDKIADARLSYVSSGEATGGTQRSKVSKLISAVVD